MKKGLLFLSFALFMSVCKCICMETGSIITLWI